MGTLMAGYDRYLDWLEEALDDYATAEDLYKLGRYSKACYFSHQACEKAVKALMIRKLGRYEALHSVAELLRRASTAVESLSELVLKADYLDRFYIPTRYPNAWPRGAPYKHYTREDAERALEYAREVIERVKEEISRDPR